MGKEEQGTCIGRDQDENPLHQGIRDSLNTIEFCCETVLKIYVDSHKVGEWPISDGMVKEDMKGVLKDTIYRFFNPTVEQIIWIDNNKSEFKTMLDEMSNELWNSIIKHISYYNNIINKGEIE